MQGREGFALKHMGMWKKILVCLLTVAVLCGCMAWPEDTARAAYVSVGDVVTFGSYEQDGNTNNGKEAIRWIVLETYGNQALLLAQSAVDCVKYNTVKENVTWETSSIREWLNWDFFYAAFNEDQRDAVICSYVENMSGNADTGKSGGSDTYDYVFLLSLDETRCYLSSQKSRVCYPTQYALNRGADYNQSGACWWWLRSPGSGKKAAVYCDATGCLEPKGNAVDNMDMGVRPAIWVDTDSYGFSGKTSSAAVSYPVGSSLYFGYYEQDGNTSNGQEYILWRVIDRQGDMALLLSEYGLDCVRYNGQKVNTSWAESDIRYWLNYDFYYTAFGDWQRSCIVSEFVNNAGNSDTGKSGGDNTWDNVFLLSLDEARAYLSGKSDRVCYLTQYAANRGADYNQSGACWWWLRSPGSGMKAAVYCDTTGYLEPKGTGVDNDDMAIRPAIWVDVSNWD